MSEHKIVGFRVLMIPSENKWAINLQLEQTEGALYVSADLIKFQTLADLAAMVTILRSVSDAKFDTEAKQIVTEAHALG